MIRRTRRVHNPTLQSCCRRLRICYLSRLLALYFHVYVQAQRPILHPATTFCSTIASSLISFYHALPSFFRRRTAQPARLPGEHTSHLIIAHICFAPFITGVLVLDLAFVVFAFRSFRSTRFFVPMPSNAS
jgi:hypothetical protein